MGWSVSPALHGEVKIYGVQLSFVYFSFSNIKVQLFQRQARLDYQIDVINSS